MLLNFITLSQSQIFWKLYLTKKKKKEKEKEILNLNVNLPENIFFLRGWFGHNKFDRQLEVARFPF